jgi:hypothetical protein
MTSEQLAFLSAAMRHSKDAEELLDSSPDQAWHLAGFGPECIRKACLEDGALYRALGHSFGEAAEELLDLAISLDAHAWRYDLVGWAQKVPHLSEWLPEHRYHSRGSHVGSEVVTFVREARALVERVLADLWADGLITGREKVNGHTL